MSIGSRIKELRIKCGITQEELAKTIGITKGAIANYENEISSPKIELMYKLFEALDCDANYLYQDDMKELYKDKSTPSEFEKIIKPYRNLDDYGRETVDIALERETARVQSLQARDDEITTLKQKLLQAAIPKRIFSYYGKIAAAGISFDFDDITAGTREYPITEVNEHADYTIGVSGDSMEPTYSDGDIVFVQKTHDIHVGDIGIFQKDNGIYIKEVGESGLLSHNKNYKPMISDSDVKCLGKVLGRAED